MCPVGRTRWEVANGVDDAVEATDGGDGDGDAAASGDDNKPATKCPELDRVPVASLPMAIPANSASLVAANGNSCAFASVRVSGSG